MSGRSARVARLAVVSLGLWMCAARPANAASAIYGGTGSASGGGVDGSCTYTETATLSGEAVERADGSIEFKVVMHSVVTPLSAPSNCWNRTESFSASSDAVQYPLLPAGAQTLTFGNDMTLYQPYRPLPWTLTVTSRTADAFSGSFTADTSGTSYSHHLSGRFSFTRKRCYEAMALHLLSANGGTVEVDTPSACECSASASAQGWLSGPVQTQAAGVVRFVWTYVAQPDARAPARTAGGVLTCGDETDMLSFIQSTSKKSFNFRTQAVVSGVRGNLP